MTRVSRWAVYYSSLLLVGVASLMLAGANSWRAPANVESRVVPQMQVLALPINQDFTDYRGLGELKRSLFAQVVLVKKPVSEPLAEQVAMVQPVEKRAKVFRHELSGIVEQYGRKTALFLDRVGGAGDHRLVKAVAGDLVGGWEVVSIANGWVVVAHEGNEQRMRVRPEVNTNLFERSRVNSDDQQKGLKEG